MPNMTAAEARAKAAEAARIARELEAEEAAKAQAEAERHDAAVAAWWEQRRDGFAERVAGKRDAAWQEFVDAVLNDGDTVAAFRRYRLVDAQVADDKASIDYYFDSQERARAEAENREYHELLREADWVRAVSVGDVVLRDDEVDGAAARIAAFEKRRDEWNAEHPREPGMSPAHDINPPARKPAGTSGLGYMEPARKMSYAEAIDRVINQHVETEMSRVRRERDALLAEL